MPPAGVPGTAEHGYAGQARALEATPRPIPIQQPLPRPDPISKANPANPDSKATSQAQSRLKDKPSLPSLPRFKGHSPQRASPANPHSGLSLCVAAPDCLCPVAPQPGLLAAVAAAADRRIAGSPHCGGFGRWLGAAARPSATPPPAGLHALHCSHCQCWDLDCGTRVLRSVATGVTALGLRLSVFLRARESGTSCE